MVNLSNWRYDGVSLWGVCEGHPKFTDGTYVHTSPVKKFELNEEGLDAYTYSGTHFHCKTEEISLVTLENTKECLAVEKLDISFLDGAEEKVKNLNKEKTEEVDKLIKDNELYLEFTGTNMRYGFFKKNGVAIPLKCGCHVGTFQDSYLIREPGVVDVRYFDRWDGIDFYHISDGIENIYFKVSSEMPFNISGIGDEAIRFEANSTEIKKVKPVNCKEGLISPDCVNGKSMISSLITESEEK